MTRSPRAWVVGALVAVGLSGVDCFEKIASATEPATPAPAATEPAMRRRAGAPTNQTPTRRPTPAVITPVPRRGPTPPVAPKEQAENEKPEKPEKVAKVEEKPHAREAKAQAALATRRPMLVRTKRAAESSEGEEGAEEMGGGGEEGGESTESTTRPNMLRRVRRFHHGTDEGDDDGAGLADRDGAEGSEPSYEAPEIDGPGEAGAGGCSQRPRSATERHHCAMRAHASPSIPRTMVLAAKRRAPVDDGARKPTVTLPKR